MKQINLFGSEFAPKEETPYTSKVQTPVYEPKNLKPHILELLDVTKANRLIREILISNVSEDEKKFLIEAAKRHNVFNYTKVADYYAHASQEMQNLMERSALVIIDFDKAIEYGYIKVSEQITNQYLQDYGNE